MAWYSILPQELTHLESWAARVFFVLGLITIGPWAFLILLDAAIWLYRMILWDFPWIGGRARGQQRPRAPSLNERPDGQRRAFGLRGVETDTGASDGSQSAIENLDPSELIPMDKTYKDRLALRKSILNQHHDIVVAVNDKPQTQDPRTHTAVSELYTFILGKYLPTRYPSMFKLRSSNSNPLLENLVTGAIHPTTLSQSTPTIEALEILTQTVDEEFLILLPELSPESNEQPKYILQAYAACFPSGFNTREKLGLRLADIHKPVPGYKEKIERSMDRFFARIEVGRFVRRVNWSVTIATDLFAAFGGTHAVVGKKEAAIEPGKLNVDETVLRCERQTLHRMPVSEALVFAFHTYTYPIRQIRDEGLGEDMAVAVDGLRKGNVPEMHIYKKGDVWGEALKEYLRS
ncbi:hypothetical protein PENARI_c032G02979 [Penicillium arizonense]|uniref:Uncharacterized protein n=1 Tax=Penicillium arizonense TaxID=1835702 RepID=A0A1F5L4I9_PENAI|nr:hypothetical protein PENARI_c032G02979 [Penicillium arizonense]OGE48112.1 hypothetical protein PENARI_c032G02979 [Penicillium arizonense]